MRKAFWQGYLLGLAILLMLVFILVSGCAGKNAISTAQDVTAGVQAELCNPTVGQVAEAVGALQLFEDYPELKEKYSAALATFTKIQARVCVTLAQVQLALVAVDAAYNSIFPLKRLLRPRPGLSELRLWVAEHQVQ